MVENLIRPAYGMFARNASQSKTLHLWRGKNGHWVPALGVTGFDTLFDVSGRGKHGILDGVVWALSQNGYALSFNGVDANVDLPASNIIMPNDNAWSVAFRFKRPSAVLDGENERLVMFRRAATGSAFNFQFDDSVAGDPLDFIYHDGGGFQSLRIETLTNLGTIEHSVGASYDGTTFRTYLDGLLDASVVDTFSGFGSGIAGLGRNIDSDNRHYNGLMGDIRAYTRALSPGEFWKIHMNPFVDLELRRPIIGRVPVAVVGVEIFRRRIEGD